ncbi:hypothetical protein CC86DRAFT_468345 [Ophiobolus disseminans]|uniref:Uncharacterized protein n=1 Tax=Ophiobolus disseminans TaxID=1469910 RepID=A0A6A6ZSW0_9PLEO|nr:hypothetical protein CC86DRAFT_468345 [Ophiobolus disseminans]
MASTDPNNTAAANATKNKAAANTSDTKTVAEGISSSPSSPSSLCGDSSTPKPESDSGSMDVSFGSSPAPSFLKFCRRRSLPGAIDVCACARARHPASSLTSGCFWELALAQLHLLQVLARNSRCNQRLMQLFANVFVK